MSGLLRGMFAARSASVLRGSSMIQRASLHTRPAKDALGVAETAIGLGLFALAILGPSGWILSHLESYKKKD